MSEDFGKQFAIAREACGLSLKDVASKIKVREEYIEDIENNVFDFPLPSVYIRGFIRNYARLLRMDVNAVMARCPVREFQVSDALRRHSGDVVEHLKDDGTLDGKSEQPPKHEQSPKSLQRASELLAGWKNKVAALPRKHLIIGVFIACCLILAICGGVFYGLQKENFDIDSIIPVAADEAQIQAHTVTLSASGNVKVVVRNKGTLEKIYSGGLVSGTVKTIAYYKPIQIFYDHGEYLLIEQEDGERICPQPGRGGVEMK